MIFISQITHDIQNNTLEVLWLESATDSINRVKNRNYSADQKADFIIDVNDQALAQKYIDLAGW